MERRFSVFIGETHFADFTYLASAKRFQAYLEKKGYSNVLIFLCDTQES